MNGDVDLISVAGYFLIFQRHKPNADFMNQLLCCFYVLASAIVQQTVHTDRLYALTKEHLE